MKKFRKFYRRNRLFLSIAILFFLLLGIYFGIHHPSFGRISSIFQDMGSHISKMFLARRVDYQHATSLQEESLKEEVAELSKLLDLKTTMAGYDMVFATVTARNVDYWFHTLTLDKGKKEGIELDMVVVNPDGLIGRITKVNRHSSIVTMITSNDADNKIAVSIHDKGNIYNGIISGYDWENNQILVTSIRSTSDVKIGNSVLTNGLGNLFPSEISIGTVEDISNDDLGVSKVLRVHSEVSFENLRYVAVLKRSDVR